MSDASAMPVRSTPWPRVSWWWAWAATRLLGMLTLDTKSYVADISFGVETNTDDAEGEAVRAVPVAPELRDLAYAREQLAAMLGPQMQVPPVFRPSRSMAFAPIRVLARAMRSTCLRAPSRSMPPT